MTTTLAASGHIVGSGLVGPRVEVQTTFTELTPPAGGAKERSATDQKISTAKHLMTEVQGRRDAPLPAGEGQEQRMIGQVDTLAGIASRGGHGANSAYSVLAGYVAGIPAYQTHKLDTAEKNAIKALSEGGLTAQQALITAFREKWGNPASFHLLKELKVTHSPLFDVLTNFSDTDPFVRSWKHRWQEGCVAAIDAGMAADMRSATTKEVEYLGQVLRHAREQAADPNHVGRACVFGERGYENACTLLLGTVKYGTTDAAAKALDTLIQHARLGHAHLTSDFMERLTDINDARIKKRCARRCAFLGKGGRLA